MRVAKTLMISVIKTFIKETAGCGVYKNDGGVSNLTSQYFQKKLSDDKLIFTVNIPTSHKK